MSDEAWMPQDHEWKVPCFDLHFSKISQLLISTENLCLVSKLVSSREDYAKVLGYLVIADVSGLSKIPQIKDKIEESWAVADPYLSKLV